MKKNLLSIISLLMLIWLPLASQETVSAVDNAIQQKIKAELLQKYGAEQKFRIDRCIEQTAALLRSEDGSPEEFSDYCRQYFIADPAALDAAFKKMEFYSEVVGGHFGEMGLDKDQPVELDWGEITPLDQAMNQFNPAAHITDDLFASKIAFFTLLNFPAYNLEEKMALAPQWTRGQWAYARMGGSNNTRIPAAVNQKISALMADAHRYVSEYNIYMGSLVDAKMKTYFPADLKLISHWGIRDELKARYADKQGLFKQQLIYKVMERIIKQEIPAIMVNSGKCQWDPASNKVYANGTEINAAGEDNVRYQTFLKTFQAMRLIDPYSPQYPTHVRRSFDLYREIPEKNVEAMFAELLASPQVKKVAVLIRKRLGRKLQPFDIWYPALRSSGAVSEEELDRLVRQKYPTAMAFEKDIVNILIKLGFSNENASYIAPKIQVDPARGSGHCAGPGSRKFKVRLRARVAPDGFDYKGFNTAMHELGHAVENVLDLYKIDFYSLAGVPNNAFTEAFAFIFQDRDLEVLGIPEKDPRQKDLKVMDTFWNIYEGAGVSLVDMRAWNWLYAHPQAKPEELKQAVIAIAKDIWNKYYAPVFGIRDQIILAIYSHMVEWTLYLPHYAIGNVIQFQVEDFLRAKVLGPEMERMLAAGNILPQLWMKNAVGSEISVKPMLKAVDRALLIANKK
jgi:hypothetical protein